MTMKSEYTMREIWTMIEDWLRINAPWIEVSLADGATETEIESLKQSLGVSLPSDFIDSYRIHNGQLPFDPIARRGGIDFLYGIPFRSLSWIQRTYSSQRDKLNWLPLASGAGFTYFLNLVSKSGSTQGGVALCDHDRGALTDVAQSYREWLLHFAVRLQLGVYVYSSELGGLVTVKDQADELESQGLDTEAIRAEYDRLRMLERMLKSVFEG